MAKPELLRDAIAHLGAPSYSMTEKERAAESHPASRGESFWQRVIQRTIAAFSRICDSSDRTTSRSTPSSTNSSHIPDIVENAPNETPRPHTSSSKRGASQMQSQLSKTDALTIDNPKKIGIFTDLSDTARRPIASIPTGRRAFSDSDNRSTASSRVKAPGGKVLSPGTLIAKIDKIPKSDLEDTLKTHPEYERNQETHEEDFFIQAMLIVKRGETDVDSTSEPRYAKIDTASPVSLVPEETLEGLGIVPYRFGSYPLHGLDQSAIVEPIGLETIFWFDPKDESEKPQIFQTTFQVLPKGTSRSFDFLLGADWIMAAKLRLAREAQHGQQTHSQSEVLYLRFLNRLQDGGNYLDKEFGAEAPSIKTI